MRFKELCHLANEFFCWLARSIFHSRHQRLSAPQNFRQSLLGVAIPVAQAWDVSLDFAFLLDKFTESFSPVN